jgi:hypothetical protein
MYDHIPIVVLQPQKDAPTSSVVAGISLPRFEPFCYSCQLNPDMMSSMLRTHSFSSLREDLILLQYP